MRKILGLLALGLLGVGIWLGMEPFRARRAAPAACNDDLFALQPGAWMKLQGCAVDLFHNAALVDRAGVQSRLVTPLRQSGDSAAEPSVLALVAVPELLVDPDAHRRKTRADATQTADISESLVVVLGSADHVPFTLKTFPQIDSGLTPDPLLLELRKPPSPKWAWLVIAGAILMGLFAVAGGHRDEVEGSRRQVRSGQPIRWGLVFVSVLVGLVALARGIQWYFDPARSSITPSAAGSPQPRALRREEVSLVPPTPEELTGVESDDAEVQRVAVERLREREITPEVVRAVDRALSRPAPSKAVEAGLVCARSRATGEGSLAYLLNRFPTDPFDIRETRSPGVACVAAALAARTDEDPLRIRDALKRAVFSDNQDAIREAVKGFRRLGPGRVPSDLVVEATNPSAFHRRAALRAAVAMGAIQTEPRFVLQAAKIDSSEHVTPIRDDLVDDPHDNSARILAHLCADGVSQFCGLLRAREAAHHDATAALLELASDSSEPLPRRRQALEQLPRLREWGVLPGLRQLRESEEEGELRPRLTAAIAALEPLERADKPSPMRALQPRGPEW